MNRLLKRLPARLSARHWVLLLFLPFDFLVALILVLADIICWPLLLFSAKKMQVLKPDLSRASIIVLNWEGQGLLEEFLPSVIEAVRHDGRDHEILVVDNGSRDGSVEFLKTHFPSVRVIALGCNRRFTGGNNAGVAAAKNDIVVFLNNDMQVDRDFLKPLLDGFQDDAVFAVSCQVFFQDKTRRREETGNTRARWALGFIEPYHGEVPEKGMAGQEYLPIFWGGGGSCAFDRNKFLAIGGLDPLYDPFYLEDTDLSYQAWKRGWKSLLAVDSVVIHKHRGTNKQKFGDNFVDNTIRKNQYLFIWKNITSFPWTLSHVLFLPVIQAGFLLQTSWQFEAKAFLRALRQFPEALLKRYRRRNEYAVEDAEIFQMTGELPG
ncbi:MAG: glycosyltransferase family 2 protein [Acidobacteria bacterium]|nr:glycosyltransferase family 2 protein [Acidobacteriota bacterium]